MFVADVNVFHLRQKKLRKINVYKKHVRKLFYV